MTPFLWLAMGPALAQDATAPTVDARLVHPSIDATTMLWVDDARMAPSGRPNTRLLLQYVNDPLILPANDPINDGLVADLMAGHVMGPLRVGADVPIVGALSSDLDEDVRVGLGDIEIDGKLSAWKNEDFGIAANARLIAPSSTIEGFGSDGIGWQVGAIGDARLGDLLFALNAGYRGIPAVRVGQVEVDDAIYARAGASYALIESAGAAVEIGGDWTIGGDTEDRLVLPVEGLVSGWWQASDTFTLRAGLGRGISDGLGTTDFRAIVGVSWAPPVAEVEAVAAEQVHVHFRLTDEEGRALPEATVVLTGPADSEWDTGDFVAELPPGEYRVEAEADGYRPLTATFEVPEGDGVWRFDRELEPTGEVRRTAFEGDVGETAGGFLPFEVHFATDRTTLTSEAETELDRLADLLLETPGIHRVEIAGHADERGPSSYNMELSYARAVVVRDRLIRDGVDARTLEIVPFGETYPLGETAAAWDEERRVRFFVVAMEPDALQGTGVALETAPDRGFELDERDDDEPAVRRVRRDVPAEDEDAVEDEILDDEQLDPLDPDAEIPESELPVRERIDPIEAGEVDLEGDEGPLDLEDVVDDEDVPVDDVEGPIDDGLLDDDDADLVDDDGVPGE